MRHVPYALVLSALAVLALGSRAASAEAPPILPVQGTLYDAAGLPIHDTYSVEFSLYADAAGSTRLWSDVLLVDFVDGVFTAYLGAGDPINHVIFRDYDQVFVGMAVDGDIEIPLFALATAPYAGYAAYCGDASTLGGTTADQIVDDALAIARAELAPVGHRTPWSDLDGVPPGFADGVDNDTDTTLTEGQVDAFVANNGLISGVAPGAGLTGGGSDGDVALSVDASWAQRRVTASCPPGSAIRAINEDGSVACEPTQRISCPRSGWVYGDQGCGDDIYITCSGGYVVSFSWGC